MINIVLSVAQWQKSTRVAELRVVGSAGPVCAGMARAGWTWRRAWPLVGTLLAGLAEPGTASDLRIRGTALEIPTDCAPITIVYEHSADHGCAFFRVNDQHGTQVLHGDCALRNERGHRQSICLPYGSYTFNMCAQSHAMRAPATSRAAARAPAQRPPTHPAARVPLAASAVCAPAHQ